MINVEKVKPTGVFTNYIYKAIPLAFDESMSYYETLCGLLAYLKETILPVINNNADATIELQTKIIELENYVNNYFENLDVQEEINNKLDDMAEHGELTDIIAQYLQLAGVLAFNTNNDLKNAENIVNGSICKTLGFNTYNDGKGAFYKIRTITSQDIVDEVNILSLTISNQLIAEKIFSNEIIILNEKVDNILSPQNYKTKKYLLVGDSYAVGYQGAGVDNIEGFFNKLVNNLNITAQIICANGYGFLGINNDLRWTDLIENSTILNKDSFTDIIIAGGMNDNASNENSLKTAMLTTFNYLKLNFPNAEIHIGCVGKYAKSSEQNLINIRKVIKIYKNFTIEKGYKYIDNSELLLHNTSWFISDNIHPNTYGETQLAYGFEQYIVNGQIKDLLSISSINDFQTDTITPSNNITLNLNAYSYINENITSFYIDGQINFTNNITINNLTDIVIGNLSSSYVCGSAYSQGLNEFITGYVYSTSLINNSHFVKVNFRLYNDYNNDLHLRAFTVSDDGDYKQLIINQIAFPYGTIKCNISSKYC